MERLNPLHIYLQLQNLTYSMYVSASHKVNLAYEHIIILVANWYLDRKEEPYAGLANSGL